MVGSIVIVSGGQNHGPANVITISSVKLQEVSLKLARRVLFCCLWALIHEKIKHELNLASTGTQLEASCGLS